jgi:hypothetical protein
MAFVICAVLLIDRILLRKSRGLFMTGESHLFNPKLKSQCRTAQRSSPCLFELIDGALHVGG